MAFLLSNSEKAARLQTIFLFCLLLTLCDACKKEEKRPPAPPPLTAASLAAGRAGIRVNTKENFKSSTSFDVSNTAATSAATLPANGNSSMRTVTIDATEIVNGAPDRRVRIAIIVPATATTANGTITLSPAIGSGTPPVAFVELESYSTFLGAVWKMESGSVVVTRLTATEIEGSFTGMATVPGSSTFGPLTIENGSFAGKF